MLCVYPDMPFVLAIVRCTRCAPRHAAMTRTRLLGNNSTHLASVASGSSLLLGSRR